MTTPAPAPRRPRWFKASALAAIVVSSAPIVGIVVAHADAEQTPPATTTTVAAPTSALATALSSAGTVSPHPVPATVSDLARIADHLVAAPYDTRNPRQDLFEYIEARVWENTTDPAASTAGAALSVRRIRWWTNARGDTGRSYAVDEARGCPAEDQRWAHQEPSPWGGPLSSAPDAVRRQLLGPPPNKGIDLWGQVGELYLYRLVPLATRRGVLRMLAGLPGVTVQRNVTDAAGRLGVAVTDTVGPAIAPPGPPVRHILIFDSATGDLLATVLTDATEQGTPDYSTPPGGHSATLGYELYLTRRYTPTIDSPKPGCIPRQ